MEIQEVRSEYFQENDTQQKQQHPHHHNHLSPATKSSTFSSATPSAYDDELVGSFAQIKLKNMSAPAAHGATGSGSLILPSIQLFTAKRGNKKKKKKRITESYLDGGDNFSKQRVGGEEEEYKDDWSKQSCDEFFVPVESFLSTQLQREKSSKRRCKIVEKVRNVENNRKYVEDRLHEYDEKISLNTLLKQSKSCSIQVSATPMNLGQLNYRYCI